MPIHVDENTTEEAWQQIREFAEEMAEILPENNYWLLSGLTILGPAILSELRHSTILFPQTQVLGPLWNYLDAGCSVMAGLLQLTDNYHHRQLVNKLKGMVNVGSGAQVIALSAISFATFGAPAFAAAFGVGFALSIDDLVRAGRRKDTLEYWVKDSLAELDKINAVILPDIKKQIADIESIAEDQRKRLTQWTLERRKQRLAEYLAKKEEIEHDLVYRMAFRKYASFDESSSVQTKQYQQELECFTKQLDPTEEQYQSYHHETTSFLTKLASMSNEITHENSHLSLQCGAKKETINIDTCYKKELTIIQKNAQEFKNNAKNTLQWGLAFAGMLCLCFPVPGAQIAGLALVGLASAIYLVRNADRISQGMISLKERFVKKDASTKEQLIPPLPLDPEQNEEKDNKMNSA